LDSPEKIDSTPSTSCFFHNEISVAWTSYRPANSLIVCSPFRAAKATEALKPAAKVRRFRPIPQPSKTTDLIV
jgi:hypothetical protein